MFYFTKKYPSASNILGKYWQAHPKFYLIQNSTLEEKKHQLLARCPFLMRPQAKENPKSNLTDLIKSGKMSFKSMRPQESKWLKKNPFQRLSKNQLSMFFFNGQSLLNLIFQLFTKHRKVLLKKTPEFCPVEQTTIITPKWELQTGRREQKGLHPDGNTKSSLKGPELIPRHTVCVFICNKLPELPLALTMKSQILKHIPSFSVTPSFA